jgi:hypothetical protein
MGARGGTRGRRARRALALFAALVLALTVVLPGGHASPAPTTEGHGPVHAAVLHPADHSADAADHQFTDSHSHCLGCGPCSLCVLVPATFPATGPIGGDPTDLEVTTLVPRPLAPPLRPPRSSRNA